MAVSGPLIAAGVASAAVGVGANAIVANQNKPSKPQIPTALLDPEKEANAQAAAAKKRQQQQIQAAFGRGDTILTAPGGLGGPATGGKKTALGY